LDLGLLYMDRKVRHRPTTFMGDQDLTRPFASSNCSNNEEVRICPAAQTLFSVQPISRVLEVQMISKFYPGNMRQFPRTFMIEVCSNYDVINDLFGRQEDKNCHQVKMWPPIHELVNKSIVPNFGL